MCVCGWQAHVISKPKCPVGMTFEAIYAFMFHPTNISKNIYVDTWAKKNTGMHPCQLYWHICIYIYVCIYNVQPDCFSSKHLTSKGNRSAKNCPKNQSYG